MTKDKDDAIAKWWNEASINTINSILIDYYESIFIKPDDLWIRDEISFQQVRLIYKFREKNESNA